MAKTDKKPKKKEEPTITVKKPDVQIIEKKPEIEDYDDDEEFESLLLNQGTSSTFRYPLMRGAMPSIRIQPVSAPLEIELGDIEIPVKEEETNGDQYKPINMDKNYSLNQKYEIAGGGGSGYDSMAPKTVTAPVSPSLTPNFSDSMNAARGFGNQNTTAGYPGQESNDRKYDSGLEQQTREQDRRRRDM